MNCSACDTNNPLGARFCNGCGTGLSATCAGCSQSNPPASRFCNACGQALTTSALSGGQAAEAGTPSPRSYTPRHLAEKILSGRDALTGERKQVTVLFADVVGSTELIHGRDPEDAQRLLDGAVECMMTAVHRYEGTVSRLMGDGLMAMFGAPVAHEDHAVRACYAALAMLEVARRYADEVRQAHGAAIQIRVGINSGEVIVRLISDDLHMDYTAMGETVHLASRMEGLAEAGTALLTPPTAVLAEGYVQVRPLGPKPVRGLAHPVEAYLLVGAGEVTTRLEAAVARGLTRFVGRQREVEAVVAALERAVTGHGQIIALVGEPGVGKSRLIYEVTHGTGADGWHVLQSSSVSYGKATPYLPIIGLLKSYGRIEASDDAETTRQRLSERLLTLDPALETIVPPLLSLLDVPVEDASWTTLDLVGRRRATLDALKRLVLRESQQQPLLLVFEDLHWIDEQTQALLDDLVDVLPTARVLQLVNYRPEYSHAWGNRSYYSQIRIDPLGEQRAAELLADLLGDEPSTRPLKTLLIGQTDGNPFFLEESVRSLVETGALAGVRGAYRLSRPVESVRVPATVQAVLAARIDRLPPEEKRLLQTAAVIGKDVPFALLDAIAEMPGADLQAGLARLQAAELLYAVSRYPDLEYTFKHALTHEVAYGSLLQERRRVLHARIVAAIERLYSDRLDEHVERLAQHAFAGQLWELAIEYQRKSGNRARMRSANREAVAHFERALGVLRSFPESRVNLERAVDLRLDLRQAQMPLGDTDRVLEITREAEAYAEALGDPYRIGRVAVVLANSLWWHAEYDRAIEAGLRGLAAAEADGDVTLQIEANQVIGHALSGRGDFRQAATRLERNVAALADDPLRQPRGMASYPAVDAGAYLAWCLAELGAFEAATGVGNEAVRIAEATNSQWDAIRSLSLVAPVYLIRGDLKTAIAMLERCTEVMNVSGIAASRRMVAFNLGTAYTLAGRTAEALPLLEHAADHPAYQRRRFTHAPANGALSAVLLALSRIEEATERAAQALEFSVNQGERGNQADALRLLAEIATRRSPPDLEEAERRYREALALAIELGMRPLQARCHLGLGKLHRRIGRPNETQAELSTAVGMLREMGMTFWLPEAESELALATEPGR